jgi:hypothetical protein
MWNRRKRKEREKHENNPCTLPTRDKEKNSGLTSVRVRINESGLRVRSKSYYQAFFWVLIDLIVELLGLIIKPFDNQTES